MTFEFSQLSDREREILSLVATGATNQQIAHQLSISPNTVKVHLRNIFNKIGVVSRTEAAVYATRIGLVNTPGVVSSNTTFDVPGTTSLGIEVSTDKDRRNQDDKPSDNTQQIKELTDTVTTKPPITNINRKIWLIGGLLIITFMLMVLIVPIVRSFWVIQEPSINANNNVNMNVPDLDQRWRELTAMPSGRSGFGLASYSYDGRQYLYAIGGETNSTVSDEVLRYEPGSNTWVSLSPKPTPVYQVQAVVVGNRIFVPGGLESSGTVSRQFEAYDPQRDRWVTLSPLPEPRSGYALATVEGKLYLFGGWDGTKYRNEVWQYNPDQDLWSEQTPMLTARAYSGAVAIEGQIYIIGGENEDSKLSVNERYIAAQDGSTMQPWTTQAPMPQPRSRMGIATAGGLIFVFNGTDNNMQALLYNSNLDSWQSLVTPLRPTLRDLRAQAVGNRIYLIGGRYDETFASQAFEYQALYTVVLPIHP